MKTLTLDDKFYLVAAPRLRNGGPDYTCDAFHGRKGRDKQNNRRIYPTNAVTGVLALDRLARAFLGID